MPAETYWALKSFVVLQGVADWDEDLPILAPLRRHGGRPLHENVLIVSPNEYKILSYHEEYKILSYHEKSITILAASLSLVK